jgi:hypothetical protein
MSPPKKQQKVAYRIKAVGMNAKGRDPGGDVLRKIELGA